MRGRLASLAVCGFLILACQTGSPPTGSAGDIAIASELPASAPEELAAGVVALQQGIKLAIDQHSTIGRFKLIYKPMDDAVAGVSNAQKGVQNVKRMIKDASVLGTGIEHLDAMLCVALWKARLRSWRAKLGWALTRDCCRCLAPPEPDTHAKFYASCLRWLAMTGPFASSIEDSSDLRDHSRWRPSRSHHALRKRRDGAIWTCLV